MNPRYDHKNYLRILLLWLWDMAVELADELFAVLNGEYPPDLYLAEVLSFVFGLVVGYYYPGFYFALPVIWLLGAGSRWLSFEVFRKVDHRHKSWRIWIVVYGWMRRVISLFMGLTIGGFGQMIITLIIGSPILIGSTIRSTQMRHSTQQLGLVATPGNRFFGILFLLAMAAGLSALSPLILLIVQVVVTGFAALMLVSAIRTGANRRKRLINAVISAVIAAAFFIVPWYIVPMFM